MAREALTGILAALLLALAWQGINVTPYLLLGGIVLLLTHFTDLKSMSKGFAPVKAKKSAELARFEKIGGQSTAKKELQEALDFVCFPNRTAQLGIRPLKGILLSGPPGTGKTLLAKAAAAYTQSAFIAASGSEFIEMYAGVGAQRVRQLFERARNMAVSEKKQSAVVFIDEIEIIGGKRGASSSHHEYDQTLNQLLVEMDGLQTQTNVRTLVIGATNRADMLDSALLRPGRFDRTVKVDLPDLSGRLEILKLHLSNKPLDENVAIEKIAKETFGFSGAHLESLANEAAILAMREDSDKITQNHLSEAVDKVIMGEKLKRTPSKNELWRVAVHEAGHALISESMRPGSVSSVTIASRGSSLGYVRQAPEDDSCLYTLSYLEDQIAILLSGSIAEEQLLESRSTGAAGDFAQAVDIAKKIVSSGMSSLSVVSSENLPDRILHRVLSGIITGQENRVRMILREREDSLLYISECLLENEKISGEFLREIASNGHHTP